MNGSSMKPVLESGDVVLMNRLSSDIGKPNRLDVVVFEREGQQPGIKRIIGLPGETVQIVDGYIYINGKQLDEHYGNEIIEEAGMAAEPVTLGEDEYFVMGDNRNDSKDSRYWIHPYVSKDKILGKAVFRYWPITKIKMIK